MASNIGSGKERQRSSFLAIESEGIDELSGSVRGDTGQPSDFNAKSGLGGHKSLLHTERFGFAEPYGGNCRLDCILNNSPVVSGRDSE